VAGAQLAAIGSGKPRTEVTPMVQATTERSTTAENTSIAVDFLEMASSGHAHEAGERYAAPDFVHHNPYFARDADTLTAAMDENAQRYPDKRHEVLRTIAEGDLVAVHSRVRLEKDGPDMATVHLFRIEDGRIREFWDVVQEVPADSPNQAGMF
jgi:predicted SnoaL-like aldol condensation-catalyzing enzyme